MNIQINPRNLFHYFICLCSVVERMANEPGWVWGVSVFSHYSVSSKTTSWELILNSDSGIVFNSVYNIPSLKKPAWRSARRYGMHTVPQTFQFLRPLPSFLRRHVSIKHANYFHCQCLFPCECTKNTTENLGESPGDLTVPSVWQVIA